MKSRWCFAGLLALAAACGGSASSQKAQDLDEFRQRQLADAELCEQAVDNYEKNEFEATDVPAERKDLFNPTARDYRHRARVRECTIKLSRTEATCIAKAASLQYVMQCPNFNVIR